MLLVLSGPSGAGKDTVIERLREVEPDLVYSVSVTTRAPRPGEVNGVHYRFTNRDEFGKLASAGFFIETREYAGNLYGTPREFVENALRQGRDLILKPEVNGARAVKQQFPQSVLVFLAVPCESDLAARLAERRSDDPKAINARLSIARQEEEALPEFDYRVVNAELEAATSDLRAILKAERLKVARLPGRSGF